MTFMVKANLMFKSETANLFKNYDFYGKSKSDV